MHLPENLKQLQINKANSTIFAAVAIASVVTVFSLISTKTLLSQAGHHKRVLDAQHKTIQQLESNIKTANSLKTQFEVFNSGAINLIGGTNNNAATGPKDGDNARIVLNALPSQYDFPALLSSVEKIVGGNGLTSRSIGGSDESATISSEPSGNPQPVVMSFTVSGANNYAGVQNLIKDFERSIRPFDITKLTLSGPNSNMAISLTINTYFQPAKQLTVSNKEVK